MILYSHPFSQHARRVRIVCHELGLKIDEKPVDLQKGEHKSDAFLEINPAGQIPVLVDGAETLAESHAIIRYLVTKHGDGALYPAKHRPQIDQWLDWTHCVLNPPVQSIAIERLSKGENADQQVIDVQSERVAAAISVYERGFTIQDVTIADFAIGTSLHLYLMMGGSLENWPRTAQRFEMLSNRPSFLATAPNT